MPRLDTLFSVTYGNKFDFNKMIPDPNGVAFVGRRSEGQGISGHVARVKGVEPYQPGLLTVALGGSYVLATFVQQAPFYTAQNVAVLSPLDPDMPLKTRLYYAMCITANRYRYTAFGREANRTLRSIDLPDEVPAWVMDTPVPTAPDLARTAGPPVPLRDSHNWKPFKLGGLFTIRKGRRLTRRNMQPGDVPYIGSSAVKNGVTNRIDATPQFPGGVLTVPYNGSVGHAFYQPVPFCAGDDVHVLEPITPCDKYSLFFVAAVIRHEKYRYNYGRKWHLERMRNTTVRLPSRDDGEPDWDYMSSYVKGLTFSGRI